MIRKGKTEVRGKIRKSNSDSRYEKMKQVGVMYMYIGVYLYSIGV